MCVCVLIGVEKFGCKWVGEISTLNVHVKAFEENKGGYIDIVSQIIPGICVDNSMSCDPKLASTKSLM